MDEHWEDTTVARRHAEAAAEALFGTRDLEGVLRDILAEIEEIRRAQEIEQIVATDLGHPSLALSCLPSRQQSALTPARAQPALACAEPAASGSYSIQLLIEAIVEVVARKIAERHPLDPFAQAVLLETRETRPNRRSGVQA